MSQQPVRSVVIVGGGAVGWTAAAVLGQAFGGGDVTINVVEHGPPAESGPGTILLPQSAQLHARLGVDEREILRRCRGAFGLGTRYQDWNRPGHGYFQPLAPSGASIAIVAFHHFVLKKRARGDQGRLEDYSLCAAAAERGVFSHPVADPNSILSTLAYGLHLDRREYARLLQSIAVSGGVQVTEGEVADVSTRSRDGFIDALVLADGREIRGDLFVDCTGSEARLIHGALGVELEDWSSWLPANRILSAELASDAELPLYASTTGDEAGWLTDTPLSEGVTRQFIYSDAFLTDEEAAARVGENTRSGPAVQVFEAGLRASPWARNCVALGAAGGGTEPLEVSELQRVQQAAVRIAELFPDRSCSPLLSRQYNRITRLEAENIRDYQLLHYLASERDDSPFWNHWRNTPLPDSLQHKLELFESHGQVTNYEQEMIDFNLWAAAMLGLGIQAKGYDPLLDSYDFDRLDQRFEQMRAAIGDALGQMHSHLDYLRGYRSRSSGA